MQYNAIPDIFFISKFAFRVKFLFRMPIESQDIEFKESWRDEYQKWICGFANA